MSEDVLNKVDFPKLLEQIGFTNVNPDAKDYLGYCLFHEDVNTKSFSANLDKGVFHCFSGEETDVQKILSYGGFSFGIGGVVTYKKSTLQEAVQHIPLDKLVLETDSPYLAPTPFRGKRNESAYITAIASKISDIFAISEQEIGRITSENARKLFSI